MERAPHNFEHFRGLANELLLSPKIQAALNLAGGESQAPRPLRRAYRRPERFAGPPAG